MTRSAVDVCYPDQRIALSDRNAVVAGPDAGLRDIDPRASLDMDAIRVRAIRRCRNPDLAASEAVALHQSNVKGLAV